MPSSRSDNDLMPHRSHGYADESGTESLTVGRKRQALSIRSIPGALCILTVLASCGSNESVTAALEEQPDTISRGFRQVTVSGNGRIEVESEMVEVYNKQNLSVFSIATLQEFNSQGELSISGRADRIELKGNRNGSAEGGIRLQDIPENSTLEAEKLIWDNKERMLRAEGLVRVETGDGLKLQGEGFVADLSRDSYRFSSGVSGSLVVEDE